MTDSDDDVHGTTTYDPATREITVDRRYESGRPNLVTRYVVSNLDPDPSIGSPAVRLTQEDGSSYDLIRTRHGWTCECPDFVNRRERKGLLCKHLKAAFRTVLAGRGGRAPDSRPSSAPTADEPR